MKEVIEDPESYLEQGDRVWDKFDSMKDGRIMWAMFYGESPRQSIYKGTEDEILTGYIHLEGPDRYESYLPTVDGRVIRVVTMTDGGELVEGPSELSDDEQLALIAWFEEQIG